MDKEKEKWFAEVGMVEIAKPLKYYCITGKYISHYSEEYIENTHLEELKKGYLNKFETRLRFKG